VADDRRALDVLDELKLAVEGGVRDQHLQLTPHLLLLSRDFYHATLKPLLAKWLVPFVRQQRMRLLTSQELEAYLLSRQRPTGGQLARATDTQMKLLNLGSDWLNALLPHVLTRTSRVHFGLLQPDDLRRALEEKPCMPSSRRVLAVPFVGKDVPSKASEFAHPGVQEEAEPCTPSRPAIWL
jgi:hypothetical protein